MIDQLDIRKEELTSAMKQVLLRLAVESSNSRVFKVVVVISNVEVRDIVLGLNSGEKVIAVNQAREFCWSNEMLQQLCDQSFTNWPAPDRERLTALVAKAGTPSLVMALWRSLRFTSRFPYGRRHNEIKKEYGKKISHKLKEWKAFDDSVVDVLKIYADHD